MTGQAAKLTKNEVGVNEVLIEIKLPKYVHQFLKDATKLIVL